MTFQEKCEQAKAFLDEQIIRYWPAIAAGSSFGKDSMVMLHLIRKVRPDCPVFTVFADTEFPETYAFAQWVAKLWNIPLTEYWFKQSALGDLSQCCGMPKVEATKEAVRGLRAWISGIRRSEGITRSDFKPIEHLGPTKINPLVWFTELDIWRYTALHRLPIHPMYQKGYRSLGCRLCSVVELSEADLERAGRWAGTSKEGGECGIHTTPLR